MMNNEKKKFEYIDMNDEKQTVELSQEDFSFVQSDKKIHDVKLETKPTTFLKDAFRRFCKDKSSVAGGIIIGTLLVLSFVLPATIPYEISSTVPLNEETFLTPKLFSAGTGWWDGTKKYDTYTIAYDLENETPVGYNKAAVVEGTLKTVEKTIDTTNQYAWGGDIKIWGTNYQNSTAGFNYSDDIRTSFNDDELYFRSTYIDNTTVFNFDYDYTLTYEINETLSSSDFTKAEYAVYFYSAQKDENGNPIKENNSIVYNYYKLKDYSKDYGKQTIDITSKIKSYDSSAKAYKYSGICFSIKRDAEKNSEILLTNAEVKSENASQTIKDKLEALSITDANETLLITKTNDKNALNEGYWEGTATKTINQAHIMYCAFRYDTYEATYGLKTGVIGGSILEQYIENGWCSIEKDSKGKFIADTFTILDEKCPIVEMISIKTSTGMGVTTVEATCVYSQYKYWGYSSMPVHIFGTDASGHDLLKLTFAGLRTSLMLGILVFIVCFSFGLVWGAIEGYFGGAVDLAMERFCDILGGVPWIVIMTLAILHFGSNFLTIAMALCLTGWMGTAGRTRTQFYRFKGREYVLASRTLGASDKRLIFKHILPNAMGTIITGAVLMIPSAIFSEASIAYLGLGLQNLSSLGVTLANNQQYLSTSPYLVVIPAVVVALIMISFNLFGNGLRDAFNPSLKGSE